MTKKRTRSPDLRIEADRPGSRTNVRLDDIETEELDSWRGNLARPQAIKAALKEKYLRFSRGK